MLAGQWLALGAGLFAALGSVSAKLAFSAALLHESCTSGLVRILSTGDPLCDTITIVLQLVFFALIFACNAVMWALFVKSLQLSSSLQATVTNTASNFFFSAVCGWLLFDEALRLLWWIGASFIVMGLVLINHSQQAVQGKQGKSQKAD